KLPPPPTRTAAGTHLPPTTPAQQTVAHIWRELLGHPAPGLDDNFFDLGGHSLLLVQAHARLRRLREDLRIVDLFRYPTLRALAEHLAGETADHTPREETEPDGLRAGRSRLKLRRRRLHDEPKGDAR
ncbi:phosphopantetheine-binding protein, partial [Rhizohabitans arisaemae]|uniref:phosphopantetheine-binding protein n=1 Tax=Rhizohabitans arisaemae TaxID=2720610 RepID=UPI0024B0D47B